MILKKHILKLYSMLGNILRKLREYYFPDEVLLMPLSLESEASFQALIDRIIEHTQKGCRVQLKLPQICTDPITNRVMDCEELVRQKMVERLKKMNQST